MAFSTAVSARRPIRASDCAIPSAICNSQSNAMMIEDAPRASAAALATVWQTGKHPMLALASWSYNKNKSTLIAVINYKRDKNNNK